GWRDNEARHIAPWAPAFESLFARRLRWSTPECTTMVDLSEKVLLIVDEGGFGDTLQSLCFIAPLAAAARKIILLTKPELEELVVHNFGAKVEVITCVESRLDDFDEWIFSWSVPTLFGGIPTFESLTAPSPVPRASFDPQALQVGLCWAAS